MWFKMAQKTKLLNSTWLDYYKLYSFPDSEKADVREFKTFFNNALKDWLFGLQESKIKPSKSTVESKSLSLMDEAKDSELASKRPEGSKSLQVVLSISSMSFSSMTMPPANTGKEGNYPRIIIQGIIDCSCLINSEINHLKSFLSLLLKDQKVIFSESWKVFTITLYQSPVIQIPNEKKTAKIGSICMRKVLFEYSKKHPDMTGLKPYEVGLLRSRVWLEGGYLALF